MNFASAISPGDLRQDPVPSVRRGGRLEWRRSAACDSGPLSPGPGGAATSVLAANSVLHFLQ